MSEIVDYYFEFEHSPLITIVFVIKTIKNGDIVFEKIPVNFSSPGKGFCLDGSLLELYAKTEDMSTILEAHDKLINMLKERK